MTKRLIGSLVVLALSAGTARTPSAAVPYCENLKDVILLAASRDKFASIAAKPRDGNFSDTSLPLPGWKDCSVYGSRTYACDNEDFGPAEEAGKVQAKIVQEIRTCLNDTWAEDKNRSSPGFVVLNHPIGFVTMTVSTDEKAKGEYVVRLILFLHSSS